MEVLFGPGVDKASKEAGVHLAAKHWGVGGGATMGGGAICNHR